MRFEFCGNLDCPEWVLAEVVQLNKIVPAKLKQLLALIVRKIFGQGLDMERAMKLCRESNLNGDESKVALSVLEFILAQAGKHSISEQVLNKDLLQIVIIVKGYVEYADQLQKSLKQQSFKISQIEGMNYKLIIQCMFIIWCYCFKLSYLFASSASGQAQNLQSGEMEALDQVVTVGIDMSEFPNNSEREKKYVKFGMTRDKFLQFSRDMKEALSLLENAQSIE